MKKRTRRCNPQRQAYWEELVRRWKESGQSVRAYCRAEGVQESAFYFWRRKLAQRSLPSGALSRPRLKASQLAPSVPSPGQRPSLHRGTPSFLPVHLTQDGPTVAAHGVEIVLAQGCTVRVRAGFDRQTLADVLAVLEVRPC